MIARLDAIEIAAAGHRLVVPFEIELTTEIASPEAAATHCVVASELLRLLPERRVVARINWAGTDAVGSEAVLKLFLGQGGTRYRAREMEGLLLLARGGACVPEILARVHSPGAVGLILRYLPESQRISPVDTDEVEQVVRLFSRLHNRGVWQQDLHLDNFLFSGGLLYAIDGDGVRKRSSMSPKRSLDNLCLLLAQRPPSADADVQRLLRAYCEEREQPGLSNRVGAVVDVLARQRKRRMRHYHAKTVRNCTEYAVLSTWWQFASCVRERLSDRLEDFFAQPEQTMRSAELLKDGNSATVVRSAELAGSGSDCYVIKRYNLKSPWHRLRRILKPQSRFRRSWCYGQWLHLLNIPTARPIALLERRTGPLRAVAHLVLEDLGRLDLGTEIDAQGLSDARCEEIVSLFMTLKNARLCHGDTKASNFLIYQDRVHLIDLDGMRTGLGHFPKDLQRFLDNWSGTPRARFEAAFRKAGLL